MSTLKYKGYTGRVDFDAWAGIFAGRVLGVTDTLTCTLPPRSPPTRQERASTSGRQRY